MNGSEHEAGTHGNSEQPGTTPRSQKVEEKFIGAWRLVSVQDEPPMRLASFDHPTGLLVYDRSGWMSAQLALKGERKPFAKGVSAGTTEEKAEAFDTYAAYYGKYTVDWNAETVTHHIADYTNPGYRGRDNVRWFEFQGENRIVLIPAEDGQGGRIERERATLRLTWERIR